jgi:DNA anti-recombination protein RmuC
MAQRLKAKRAVEVETANGGNGNGNGGGTHIGVAVYDEALREIERVAASEAERRRLQSGVLHEARGDDVLRLHTTLHALNALRDQLSADIAHIQARLGSSDESVGSELERLRGETQEGFTKTWQTVNERFDKTWETVGHNFEATNERTSREVSDLRDELTKVLDKRFTHIDQTFASLRADIEVVKALQMDLIKERIGRSDARR